MDEDTGGDGSWTSTSRKKQKLSSSTQDNSDIVDVSLHLCRVPSTQVGVYMLILDLCHMLHTW